MKITKLGHCAMVLEYEGVKLLTDPGSFTVEQQNAVAGLHGILITHEHQDHLHVDSLKTVLANNPTAIIVGNSAVTKIIKARTAFGVHDGMIQPFFRSFVGGLLERFVPETKYFALQDGETKEF